MTQDEFIAARGAAWSELDALLQSAKPKLLRKEPQRITRIAALYRALSGDIARAEGARYATDLLAYLERLAARSHTLLYAAPPWRLRAVWDFLAGGFPAALRRRWRFFALAAALFFVPLAIGFVGALLSPSFAERVAPRQMLVQAAESYGQGFGAGRGSGEGALMTGFYINNNIGIAFRCFATGIFFGLGSVFFEIYNGLLIGTVLGFVVASGHGANILSFVVTHSPFELTAIVISGGAGLQMGFALVRTRGETRLASLVRQGPEILTLVLGAALMLFIAALIEGLWSGSSLPIPVKLAAGLTMTTLVALYLAFAGRGRAHPTPAARGPHAGGSA